MRTILNTIRIVLGIRNTVNINVILHGIRKIPIIGKHIPEEIYSIGIFKIFAGIMSVIREIFKAFLWQFFVFFGVAVGTLIINSISGFSKGAAFIYLFLFVSIISAMAGNAFKSTPEGNYAVFHIGMDARNYVIAKFAYDAFTMVISHFVFGIPAALLSEVPWFLALFLPLAGLGFMSLPLGVMMSVYSMRQAKDKKNDDKGNLIAFSLNAHPNILAIAVFVVCFAFFFVGAALIFEGVVLPIYLVYVVIFVAAVPGILLMKSFPYGLYRMALYAEKVSYDTAKINQKRQSGGFVKVKVNDSVKGESKASGYKYLNDLFMQRHSKLLWRKMIWNILIVAIAVASAFVLLYVEVVRYGAPEKSVVRYICTKQGGAYIFAIAVFNIGAYMCHVMYASCDSAMLSYAFYKTPQALRKMFWNRVMSVFKFNLPLAGLGAILAVVVIFASGGESYPLQTLCAVITAVSANLLFSARHIILYYMMQPFNSDLTIKSKFYLFLSFVHGTVILIIAVIPMPLWFTALASSGVCGLYLLCGDFLVRKFGPRTFRIK